MKLNLVQSGAPYPLSWNTLTLGTTCNNSLISVCNDRMNLHCFGRVTGKPTGSETNGSQTPVAKAVIAIVAATKQKSVFVVYIRRSAAMNADEHFRIRTDTNVT